MIETLYSLKCDGPCGRGTSVVAATIKALINREITNGPWVQRDGKHLCPACALGMLPPRVRKRPNPAVVAARLGKGGAA